jgi:hypothetical protein
MLSKKYFACSVKPLNPCQSFALLKNVQRRLERDLRRTFAVPAASLIAPGSSSITARIAGFVGLEGARKTTIVLAAMRALGLRIGSCTIVRTISCVQIAQCAKRTCLAVEGLLTICVADTPCIPIAGFSTLRLHTPALFAKSLSRPCRLIFVVSIA